MILASVVRSFFLGAVIAAALGSSAAARPALARASGPSDPGRVVLLSRPFELDAASARAIAGDGPYLRLSITAGSAPGVDPLAQSGVAATSQALDPADHASGNARDATLALRAARCIVLEADRALDGYHVLLPGGALSRVGRALHEAHAAGATVVGAGAAAGFLGQWTLVPRAELERPVRNPRDPSTNLYLEGLGLVRGALIDGEVAGRGVERLLRALSAGGLDQAVWLAGEVALIVDARADRASVVGPGEVLWFDATRARRVTGALRSGRLARLSQGASFELRSRRLAGPVAGFEAEPATKPPSVEAADLLDAAGLSRILGREPASGTWTAPRVRLSLARDEDSAREASPRGERVSFGGLRFDLEWQAD